jgi:hypothetical protein
MKRTNLNLAFIATITILSGCAVGRKLSFENKQTGPDFTTTKSASIAFRDERPSVLAGKSKPSLCGHINSTLQISYNVQTANGKPLAEEFAQSVTVSYNKAGAPANTLIAGSNINQEALIAAFKKENKDRLLIFSIKDWDAKGVPRFSTIRYEVICEFVLQVYDKDGNLLVSDSTHDWLEREEGSSVTVKRLQGFADEELNKQVTALFNKEAIKNSL